MKTFLSWASSFHFTLLNSAGKDPSLIPGSGRSPGEGLFTSVFLGFPGNSAGKESACNEGDLGLIPGLGRSLEKGMATHSNILAWRIGVGYNWVIFTFIVTIIIIIIIEFNCNLRKCLSFNEWHFQIKSYTKYKTEPHFSQ